MDYSKMIETLESYDNSVRLSYHGYQNGKWMYALVKNNGIQNSLQNDFPTENTATTLNGFIVSLQYTLDNEEDINTAFAYCGIYVG